MWKRPRIWITLALVILLNIGAWDMRTQPEAGAGAISRDHHQVDAVNCAISGLSSAAIGANPVL